jgi:uncharacterized protein (TIGR00269 family)
MKCRKCGQRAAIHLSEHRLALCKDHFLEWLPDQTQRFIEKYHMFSHEDRILVAVSGGKDSLSLWDVLWRLGYHTEGLYIGLGIKGEMDYSHQSRAFAEQFARERNLKLQVIDVLKTYAESIPQVAQRTQRGQGRPCSVCGISKRHIMNQAAHAGGYTVLVTGHNLDDEAAVLMGNTLNWIGEQLIRQNPVLVAHEGLVRKAKPFCRLYERETAAYALLRGIEYVYDECPYSVGSKMLYYKTILNQLEADRPGAKLNFYLSFLQARENGLFALQERTEEQPLHACTACGQLTTSEGLCAFCKQHNL